MKIASFFSGAGGLDLGFTNEGFELVYANDNWSGCWKTFEKNHKVDIDRRSIIDIQPSEIPKVIGIIGGPPCQSWSLAGKMRGVEDPRGKLFWNYINLIEKKKPLFFLAENVPGLLSPQHKSEFIKILQKFLDIGYNISFKLLNSKYYSVPQERKRIFIVGYHKKLGKKFEFPKAKSAPLTLKSSIGDLIAPLPHNEKTKSELLKFNQVPNHEYLIGSFSTIYMSRNRVKNWDEQSFTIQAGGRYAPIHPQAPKMVFVEKDKRIFVKGKEHLYRRLSVRECARIQTFPDSFIFYYTNVLDGYKMIGNAVPVKLAEAIAHEIKLDLEEYFSKQKSN